MNEMKTTIELDEDKLKRVMSLTGLKTRKEAVDYALTEALRMATLEDIRKNPWSADFLKEAVDEDYDILALRRQPVSYRAGK